MKKGPGEVVEKLKIISGGQTGADRAALDWAIANQVPHGGWCPKNRWAEDGPIDSKYQLEEAPGPSPVQRTEWNVRDSDGTVIFSIREKLSGGSLRTLEFARELGKPCLHLSPGGSVRGPAAKLKAFVQEHAIRVLNVAGPRASQEPDVKVFVVAVLERAFSDA